MVIGDSILFFLGALPMTDTPSITRQLIAEQERVNHTAALFGINFSLKLEPFVFFMADTMCEEYNGGYWKFYALSNDGFFMAPSTDASFHVSCENGFEGTLSADAFGVVVGCAGRVPS